MKKLLLLSVLFLACLCTPGSAQQTTFAPVGAEWYYDMGGTGVFHTSVTGDTVIQGISCRHVRQKAVTSWFYVSKGLVVNDLPDLYIYNTADTVFVYNRIYQKFTPLYVFNVQAGDTVRLPMLPATPRAFYGQYLDSLNELVVDSVKMVTYDTALLKTVYAHNVDTNVGFLRKLVESWDEINNESVYEERIGGIRTGLLPICQTCIDFLDDHGQFPGSIRCYHDNTLAIKLVNDDCAKGIKEGIPNGPVLSDEVYLYPNPSSGTTSITYVNNKNPLLDMTVTDILGRNMERQQFTGYQKDITIHSANWAQGIYTVKLVFADKTTHTLRLEKI